VIRQRRNLAQPAIGVANFQDLLQQSGEHPVVSFLTLDTGGSRRGTFHVRTPLIRDEQPYLELAIEGREKLERYLVT
jgi:hypothetical protein